MRTVAASVRQDNRVDDVNNAVRRFDVGHHEGGGADRDRIGYGVDGDRLTLKVLTSVIFDWMSACITLPDTTW